jgi:hypothetical protein
MPVPANTPATVALGPHGYGYIYHGRGRPDRIDLRTGDIEPAGLDAPTAAPVVTAQGATKYYIPRIDVVEFGYLYHTPPAVDIVGACERPAKARAFLRDGQLDEIRISDYGKGYSETPAIHLSESHASGLVLAAVLEDQPTPPAGGSAATVPVPVKSIDIVNAGSQYLTPPKLSVSSTSGSGMTAKATVAGGKVTSISVVEPGGGYTSPPTVTPIQGGATAVAIARAHVRGQYEC